LTISLLTQFFSTLRQILKCNFIFRNTYRVLEKINKLLERDFLLVIIVITATFGFYFIEKFEKVAKTPLQVAGIFQHNTKLNLAQN